MRIIPGSAQGANQDLGYFGEPEMKEALLRQALASSELKKRLKPGTPHPQPLSRAEKAKRNKRKPGRPKKHLEVRSEVSRTVVDQFFTSIQSPRPTGRRNGYTGNQRWRLAAFAIASLIIEWKDEEIPMKSFKLLPFAPQRDGELRDLVGQVCQIMGSIRGAYRASTPYYDGHARTYRIPAAARVRLALGPRLSFDEFQRLV